jgi:hypothetical protein
VHLILLCLIKFLHPVEVATGQARIDEVGVEKPLFPKGIDSGRTIHAPRVRPHKPVVTSPSRPIARQLMTDAKNQNVDLWLRETPRIGLPE